MKQEPILFLDLDGVLNSGIYFDNRAGVGVVVFSDQGGLIDPSAVVHLNRICRETGCIVVLSSSWRETTPLDQIEGWLRAAGFAGSLAGKTATIRHGVQRHLEIEHWLDVNGAWGRSHVAIDDDPGPIGRVTWVVTSYTEGLTAEKADEAIRLLQGGVS